MFAATCSEFFGTSLPIAGAANGLGQADFKSGEAVKKTPLSSFH